VRMAARRSSGLLELSEMRLPLIALIDVILFLLMYFLLAGSLESEERELAATLGSGSAVAGDSGGFTAQVVEVAWDGKRTVFRIGARPPMGRDAMVEVLRALPKEPGVVVRVSDAVPVSDAAGALQACRDAGFTRVAYQPRAGGTPDSGSAAVP
jgi:biopolymer transport protein ExbD